MEHETIQPNKIKMTEKQGCKNKLSLISSLQS